MTEHVPPRDTSSDDSKKSEKPSIPSPALRQRARSAPPYLVDLGRFHRPAQPGPTSGQLRRARRRQGGRHLPAQLRVESNDEVFDHLTRDMQERRSNHPQDQVLKYQRPENIRRRSGLGKRINSVMQAAFFKISRILPADEAIQLIKKAIKKSFEKKGEDIVRMNWGGGGLAPAPPCRRSEVPADVEGDQEVGRGGPS